MKIIGHAKHGTGRQKRKQEAKSGGEVRVGTGGYGCGWMKRELFVFSVAFFRFLPAIMRDVSKQVAWILCSHVVYTAVEKAIVTWT